MTRPVSRPVSVAPIELTGTSTTMAKYVFPVVWFTFWLVFPFVVVERPEAALIGRAMAFAAAGTLFGLLVMWPLFGLKSLTVAGDRLVIGGHSILQEVPLEAIHDVVVMKSFHFNGVRPVIVKLAVPTAFGMSVTFLPESPTSVTRLMEAWERRTDSLLQARDRPPPSRRWRPHAAPSRLPLPKRVDRD